MKVVALVSGGKDSCYNMQLCQSYGHEIVALANLLPLEDAVDELDSFMYQTVGHQVVAAFAHCMGIPLFRRRIQGSPRAKGLRYSVTEGDEVEDLEILLRAVKNRVPGLGGVSTGAIASDYQRLRVENVCSRLGLVSLAYMWRQDQVSLLQNMIDSGLHAVLVKVAAMGLDPHKHLGKDLTTLQPLLMKLQDLYGCNVCGEGGEYESLTLDCSLFKEAKIVLDEFTIELHSPDTIAPVGVLHPVAFHLEYKSASHELDVIMPGMAVEIKNKDFELETSEGKPEVSPNGTCFTGNQVAGVQTGLCTRINKQRHGFIAISCYRQVDEPPLQGVQCELDSILAEIERSLQLEDLCWANVLYVHVYLKDMSTFGKANDMYVRHITEKNNVRGVPSRCCVELPLAEAAMGHVAVEILAARDQSKNVLHVQSISSWAPSCIGPYSQATQHHQLMYMAGQLGLDPPTMNLVSGGAACEMAQALKNCEAVAKVFTPASLKSVLSFTLYCSSAGGIKGMHEAQGILDKILLIGEDLVTKRQGTVMFRPLVLYILLPALPKGALVEVSPLTYVPGASLTYPDADEGPGPSWEEISMQSLTDGLSVSRACISCKGLILPGQLCRAFAFHSFLTSSGEEKLPGSLSHGQVALKQALQLLSNILSQASLGWADVFVFCLYFVVDKIHVEELSETLETVLEDYRLLNIPQPTLIPVLGIGETAKVEDLIALELTASGGHQ